MPAAKRDVDTAKACMALAVGGDKLPEDAPCCAYCAGIKMDSMQQPEAPSKMLKRGSGCPLSIVAYQIQSHRQKGDDVEVIATTCGAPYLRVNGKPLDPLQHYSREDCGCKP